MKAVDFYSLPRAVQDRLRDSLGGRYAPLPILHRTGTRPKAAIWLGVSAAASASLVALYFLGLGKSHSSLALHAPPLIALYALLCAAAIGGLLAAIAYRADVKALPFSPGVYLFGTGVLDAREPRLRIHPLEGATRIAPGGGASVAVAVGGEQFALPVSDGARVAEAVQLIESAKQKAGGLDARARFEIDPLEAPAVTSPLGPQIPLARNAPVWQRQRWLVGVVAGCLLGAALHHLRNTVSDNRMLAVARARDDVAGYQSYLARGKLHREPVSQVLLPRAELRIAAQEGSVAAIDAFIQAHPKTGIQPEVDAARRTALIGEFERARAAGTLSELLAFSARHPDHGMGPAYDQARHALFVGARKRYEKLMPEDGQKTLELVGNLLADSEKAGAKSGPEGNRGPAVKIRFQRLPSLSFNRADIAIGKNPMFNGTTSYASQYFNDARVRSHEEQLAKDLGTLLGRAFDPELATFELGPAIEGASEDAPKVTEPTLVVSYRVEWSGGAFARKKPRGVYIGVLVFFKTLFLIPDVAEPLSTKFTAAENISQEVLDQLADATTPGAREAAVYESMTRDAFKQLRDRYAAKWFKDAPQPK